MDIVDKVFEGLSLSDQAEKARKITAHQRKKEFKKRQTLRLAAVGLVGVVVLGAIVTTIVTHMPKTAKADTEITVDFTTEKTIEPETLTIDETPAEADANADKATDDAANNAAASDAGASKNTKSNSSTKKNTRKTTSKASSSAATTTKKSWIDSNGEKMDQGSTGENGCIEYAKNSMYCKDAPSPSSTDSQTGDDEGEQGDVEQKDEGGSGDSGASDSGAGDSGAGDSGASDSGSGEGN